jgi:hypothetical protein
MKIKKRYSIEKLKNIFLSNYQSENRNNSFEHNPNLRLFSPKIIKKESPLVYFKSPKNLNYENNISKLFINNVSFKSSNINNPLLLSKTISSSNIYRNQKISSYNLNNQIIDKKISNNNSNQFIERTWEIPESQKVSFINELTNKIYSKTPKNNLTNLKLVKSKSDSSILKKNKLDKKDEKMINEILFDRMKTRNLKNKNANGEICDDVTSQVNLEPFMNSYGKILYDSIRKSDFIINTINVIYPKVSKTHFFIKDLRNKKNEMLRAHSYISFLPLQNNTNNRIYKINPIKRTIKVHSKYPINFSKTNYNHFFYRSKSKQILYDDCKIFKYNDIII